MCGIVLLSGPEARARLPGCLARLRHRGPDDRGEWFDAGLALGFNRLAINGVGPAGPPPPPHEGLVGVSNGEVYNHEQLAREYDLPRSECDAHVFLPLLDRLGARAIDELDGFYSAVALRPSTREVICLRDHMGKKPLFVGRSRSEIFIASELKAFDEIEWFRLLARGASRVDLDTGQAELLADHSPQRPPEGLADLFEQAVLRRLPRADQPLGVFLSGGLDSSLVAAVVSRFRDDATYFTLGEADGPDRQAVELVVAALGLKDVRSVALPTPERLPDLIHAVSRAAESYNPSIVSNGLATYLLAEAAHAAGIKVVLTGEGADELFGGYHSFGRGDPWREVRRQLIDDMQVTELRRLDLSCMAHSVEPRCPFLDRAVRGFSDGLEFEEMYDGGENKVALRRSFEGALPSSVLHRRKTSFDVGSGVRRQVVEYLRRNGRSERDELRDLWRQSFMHDPSVPYFHAYPVFDDVIERRGATHR